MPKYELNYKKEIKLSSTYQVVRLIRNIEGEAPQYLNAIDEAHPGYPAEKKVNVGGSNSLFLVRDEHSEFFYDDLLKLHQMIMSLIIDAGPTLVLATKHEIDKYDEETAKKTWFKDNVSPIVITSALEKAIEAAFQYAKEQRFLAYTRHTEQQMPVAPEIAENEDATSTNKLRK